MSNNNEYGPTLRISREVLQEKHRGEGESFEDGCIRIANALKDDYEHFQILRSILLNQRFLPAGRVQTAVGAIREVTAFNCFASGKIEDSMESIMRMATEGATTMRLGGGIGYNFSHLRPKGDRIKSLDSRSSGPVSFMDIFNSICKTISSAGHRRGAQMGILNVDHPDIEEFIRVKQNSTNLTAFNLSIGITNKFMQAVRDDTAFDLVFEGKVYKTIRARSLWEEIMRSTWDWAEPGVLFLDRINEMNNLYFIENIEITNPCAEQPLPYYGACLLGSFNLVKYLRGNSPNLSFDYAQFEADVAPVVRALDNVHNISIFPLPQQKQESYNKRRIGIGITGTANAGEILGHEYGTPEYLEWLEKVLVVLRDAAYNTSIDLAKEKGPFPLFDREKYTSSSFIKTLPQKIRSRIKKHGIRNSHLLSIAPTGTISLAADNVSSGIEPVFSYAYDRTIITDEGAVVERVEDYAYRVYGVRGKTAKECTTKDHLNSLILSTKYVDSSVSKTINIDPNTKWEDFKMIYMLAWENGCKGCTTFNPEGKRYGILNEVTAEEAASTCYIDLDTGKKTCE